MGYQFTNSKNKLYFLNQKEVTLRGGTQRTLYFFSLDERDTACDLPAGMTVVEAPKSSLPLLKKA